MTLEFCKTKTDLQLIIYHKGKKTEEYLSEGRNNGQVSTLVLELFGSHAMFRDNNKHGAIKSNIKITNDEENYEYDYELPITIAAISKAKPPVFFRMD